MSYVQETVDDLDFHFADLDGAGGDEARQRRALKCTLDNLYRLRAHRENGLGYLSRANSCDPGNVTEGITFLRGVLTHHLTKPVAPTSATLYPRETLYPSDHLYPESNLTWLDAADVFRLHPPPPTGWGKGRQQQANCYRSHVGGRLVLSTIRTARDFLVSDPQLGPL